MRSFVPMPFRDLLSACGYEESKVTSAK